MLLVGAVARPVEVLDVEVLEMLVLDILELDIDMPESEVLEVLVLLEDVLVLLVEVLDVEVLEILALDVLELDVNAERGSKGIWKKNRHSKVHEYTSSRGTRLSPSH